MLQVVLVAAEPETEEISKKVEQDVLVSPDSETKKISKKVEQAALVAPVSKTEEISKKVEPAALVAPLSETQEISKKVEQVVLVAAESKTEVTSKKVEQVVSEESCSEKVNATSTPVPTRADSLDASDIAKSRIAKILSKIKAAAARTEGTVASFDRQDSAPRRDSMPSIVDKASDLEDQCGS